MRVVVTLLDLRRQPVGQQLVQSVLVAVTDGDLTRGFEIAHSLKGVTGNLALTPVDKPIREITELLRAGTQADYTALLDEILARKRELDAMNG